MASFIKASYTDFPGKQVSSILFTEGCNLRCGWCHNSELVNETTNEYVDPYEIVEYVQKSNHRCLVVSGGECTIQKDLIPFLEMCKEAGITVKLDTNGTNPRVLQKILTKKLVEFVAMDVKSRFDRYKIVAGKAVSSRVLNKSVGLIKDSCVKYQFRTTVVPDLVDIEDIAFIKEEVGVVPKIQRFRCSSTCVDEQYRIHREHSDDEFESFMESINKL